MNLLIIVLVIAFIWLIRKFAWDVEEGTIEQRERNPELNTRNYEMHEKRLEYFFKSKYKNRMFYLTADGSCYYYSSSGRKFYC